MRSQRSTGSRSVRRSRPKDPKSGSRVTVVFGGNRADGVVIDKTITGRYMVRLQIDGADDPITTSFTRDELDVA